MKSLVWKAVLVFSLALNSAVAATVGYYLWRGYGSFGSTTIIAGPCFSGEAQRVLETPDAQLCRREMMEKRRRVQEKKSKVLDIIAANPGNLEPAKRHIDELLLLQAQMQTAALSRISKIMAGLPEEERQQFLATLKNRACRGPGMMGPCGFGRMGTKGRYLHPDQLPKPPPEN